MTLAHHILFALCYGVPATVLALLLPIANPEIGPWSALAFGALLLTFGAVIHESYARQQRERAVAGELAALAEMRDTVLDEVYRTREEMRILQEKLEEVRAHPRQSVDLSGQVALELEMIENLVEHLTGHNRAAAEAQDQADGGDGITGARTRRRPLDTSARDRLEGGLDLATDLLSDTEILDLVREAVRRDRIDVALQPIVSLPQRKPRLYECFGQIRTAENRYLNPSAYLHLAEEEGLISSIDNLLLFRSMQLVRRAIKHNRSVSYFVTISPWTLRDRQFLGQFLDFLEDNPELAPRLVFQFRQVDLEAAAEAFRDTLGALSDLGSRFCMTDGQDLAEIEVPDLAEDWVRFLKVDAKRLLEELTRTVPLLDLIDLKDQLDQHAIDLIVDGIPDEQTLVEILDLPIDFGQGALFGLPRVG